VNQATVPVTLAAVVAVIKAKAGTIILDFLKFFFILVFLSFLYYLRKSNKKPLRL
jgi:hypothetical protein